MIGWDTLNKGFAFAHCQDTALSSAGIDLFSVSLDDGKRSEMIREKNDDSWALFAGTANSDGKNRYFADATAKF